MRRISLIMILFFSAALFFTYGVDNVNAKPKRKHHVKYSKKHSRKSIAKEPSARKLAGGETDYKVGANIIGVADDNLKEFTYIDLGSTNGVKTGDRFLVQGKYGKIMVEVVQAFSKMSSVKVVDSWLLAEGDRASIIPESMYPRVKVKKYNIVELTKPRHKKLAKKKKEGPAVSAQAVVAPAVPGGLGAPAAASTAGAPPAAPGMETPGAPSMEAPPGMETAAPAVPEAGAAPEAPASAAAAGTPPAAPGMETPGAPAMEAPGAPGMEAPLGMETAAPSSPSKAGTNSAQPSSASAPQAAAPALPSGEPVPPGLTGDAPAAPSEAPLPDSTGGTNMPAPGDALPPLP